MVYLNITEKHLEYVKLIVFKNKLNKLTGQFVSSMWYNIKIPEKEYEVVIVQVNENIVTVEMPKILSGVTEIFCLISIFFIFKLYK